ncbi:3'-5' exonuclease [Sporobolomyces koalae]|uniref:3'-5' exonuclease n=1 Tax=Sporobolomyces koalae TaxID=500713 RepID=UPI00317CFB70
MSASRGQDWKPGQPISFAQARDTRSDSRSEHSKSALTGPGPFRRRPSAIWKAAGCDTQTQNEFEPAEQVTRAGTQFSIEEVPADCSHRGLKSQPASSHRLAPTLSKADLDELLGGIDFDDNSFEFDLAQDPAMHEPLTSQAAPTQLEAAEVVSEIDPTRYMNLSAVGPVPAAPSSSAAFVPRPRSSPRIVVRTDTLPRASTPPTIPSEPDVFTLSSTPPLPTHTVRSPQSRSVSRASLTLTPSSPLVLSSSPYAGSSSSSIRFLTTSPKVVSNDKQKVSESVGRFIDHTGDSSVEIIESYSVKVVPEKENISPSPAGSPAPAAKITKPGFFIRPATLKPLASITAPDRRESTKRVVGSNGPREPPRSAFKGRNADGRYQAAYKQYRLQKKWPVHFDYETWGTKKPTIVFTTDEQVVEQTLGKLRGPTGFDLEWDMFDKKTRGQGKTALVQVCDEDTILLVQVARMKTFPSSLKAFIEDPTKIKLGVQISGDGKKLERDFGFKPRGLLELNDLTRRYDPQRHLNRYGLIGLQELVGIYLDRYLPKDNSVRCGVWSGELSRDQKSYGANDVFSSLHVLLALQSLIAASAGSDLNLLSMTTPGARRASPIPISSESAGRSARAGSPTVPKGIASLPPRKLEAYQAFQVDKLSIADTAQRMSETSSIKPTSVLWNLLGIYSSFERDKIEAEWDIDRIVAEVDLLGDQFTGRMAAEHGALVDRLRGKLAGGAKSES